MSCSYAHIACHVSVKAKGLRIPFCAKADDNINDVNILWLR